MKTIEALLWGFSCGVSCCAISNQLAKDFGNSAKAISSPVKKMDKIIDSKDVGFSFGNTEKTAYFLKKCDVVYDQN